MTTSGLWIRYEMRNWSDKNSTTIPKSCFLGSDITKFSEKSEFSGEYKFSFKKRGLSCEFIWSDTGFLSIFRWKNEIVLRKRCKHLVWNTYFLSELLKNHERPWKWAIILRTWTIWEKIIKFLSILLPKFEYFCWKTTIGIYAILRNACWTAWRRILFPIISLSTKKRTASDVI